MVARIPLKLARDVKRHRRVLQDLIKPGNKRKLMLRTAKKSLFATIKSLFSNILNGKLTAPLDLNNSLITHMKRLVRARNADTVVQQNGSGIIAALTKIIPMVLALLPSLFKKK